MPNQTLPFDQALATVLAHATALPTPTATETLPLHQTLGRTLATPVLADRDQPPFDRATRDGYAVRSADLPNPLTLIGQIRAGESWQGPPLAAGQAIEIMTGAPVPAGADAVLMVEHATLTPTTNLSSRPESAHFADAAVRPAAPLASDQTLTPQRTLRPGENIVPRAAEARAGQTLLPVGRRLAAAEIAVAASCGCSTLEVFELPKVAIIATGDELVELNETPADHQIRNSNSYALKALVTAEGGFSGKLPIARDTRADLFERIAAGSMWDLMLLSGGVSMGKYDLVEEVLTEFGAEFFFTGALIQPGKPIVFGRLPKRGAFQTTEAGEYLVPPERGVPPGTGWQGDWTYFFGLPGNPISTQVCFHLFVAPFLRALAGRTDLAPRFVQATLAEDIPGGAAVTRFLPAELTSTYLRTEVRLTGWQGSGDLAANARGNGYCVLPTGPAHFQAGETVRILLR
jgi:molybdopterin molybdotransferase